jgi:hypothetical protein
MILRCDQNDIRESIGNQSYYLNSVKNRSMAKRNLSFCRCKLCFVVSVAENLLSPFAPRKKRNSRYFRGAKGDDYANPLFPQQKLCRAIHGPYPPKAVLGPCLSTGSRRRIVFRE